MGNIVAFMLNLRNDVIGVRFQIYTHYNGLYFRVRSNDHPLFQAILLFNPFLILAFPDNKQPDQE